MQAADLEKLSVMAFCCREFLGGLADEKKGIRCELWVEQCV